MLSDTIKICERVKRPRVTSSPSSMPLGLRNATHVASLYMKCKIQIESGPKTQDCGSRRSHLDEPCPIHENPKHTHTPVPNPQEVPSTAYCGTPPPAKPIDISGSPRDSDHPHNHLPELSGRRARNPKSPHLGRLCGCTTARWRNR
jgi:hypothetical protein